MKIDTERLAAAMHAIRVEWMRAMLVPPGNELAKGFPLKHIVMSYSQLSDSDKQYYRDLFQAHFGWLLDQISELVSGRERHYQGQTNDSTAGTVDDDWRRIKAMALDIYDSRGAIARRLLEHVHGTGPQPR